MVPALVGASPANSLSITAPPRCGYRSPPLFRIRSHGLGGPRRLRLSTSHFLAAALRSSSSSGGGNTCSRAASRRGFPRSSASASSGAAQPVSEDVNGEDFNGGLLARGSKLYRPAVILPGLGNNSGDYNALVNTLQGMGVASTVVKVARIDWLRNAAGLLDGNYWRGKLRPRPVLDWYLNRVGNAIEVAKHGAVDGKVSLVAHSAGGWLARIYMAEFGTQDIFMLLTLGTPHLPPPRGVPGVFDQTRGLLHYVEETCPGAYHAPDVKYVCVAGRYLKGGGRAAENKKTPVLATGAGTIDITGVASKHDGVKEVESAISANDGSLAEKLADEVVTAEGRPESLTATNPTIRERIVGAGYKQVCGRADVWGDGVVPEESAFLDGAENISLDGVYHSPVGANGSERPWYGSAGKIDAWVHHLFDT